MVRKGRLQGAMVSRASCGAGCSPRTRCLHQALAANVGRITPATATHVMKRRTGTKTNPESAASPAEVCSEEHDCSTESRERSEARLLQPGCATPAAPGSIRSGSGERKRAAISAGGGGNKD